MQKKPLIIPIFILFWGCKQRCIFCDQGKITGQGRPMIDTSEIGRTIESRLLSAAARPRRFCRVEVAFYGGTFTALPPPVRERLLAAVAPFINSGQVAMVRISTRPDALGPDILPQLKKFGVSIIELGAQFESDLSLEILLKAIAQRGIERGSTITIKVPPTELSNYIGYRRRNLERIRLHYDFERFEIAADATLAGGFLAIEDRGGTEIIDGAALL